MSYYIRVFHYFNNDFDFAFHSVQLKRRMWHLSQFACRKLMFYVAHVMYCAPSSLAQRLLSLHNPQQMISLWFSRLGPSASLVENIYQHYDTKCKIRRAKIMPDHRRYSCPRLMIMMDTGGAYIKDLLIEKLWNNLLPPVAKTGPLYTSWIFCITILLR